MKTSKKRFIFTASFVIIVLSIVIYHFDLLSVLSFENFKNNREYLKAFVNRHYLTSTIVFMLSFVVMSFGIPVAAFATLLGGFLFGWVHGFMFSLAGITIGSAPAYLFSKYVIGNWISHKFSHRIENMKTEIEQNKISYLITVRFIPSFPLFVVNFIAGISDISLGTLVTTTFFGMLPYCMVYSYAGNNLGNINSTAEVLSPKILLIFATLTLISFLPVITNKLKRRQA